MLRGQRRQRQAQAVADAGMFEQRLERNRVRFDAEEIDAAAQARIERVRSARIAAAGEVAQPAKAARQHVRRHRHHAVGAGKHRPAGGRVVAAEHREAFGLQPEQRLHAFGLAARFLDADDARVRRKRGHGLRQQVATGAPGHVVQHHRQRTVVGDRAVMREQSGLGRAHVRRRHHQRGVGAKRGDAPGLFDGLGGVGQAGAGEHRHPAGDDFHRGAQDRVVFHVVQRRRFAGRSGDDQRLGAAVELRLEQPAPGVEIDFAGDGERRRERGDAAGESQAGGLSVRGPRQAREPDQ